MDNVDKKNHTYFSMCVYFKASWTNLFSENTVINDLTARVGSATITLQCSEQCMTLGAREGTRVIV